MSKIIISFLLCVALWAAGLLWFITQIPAQPIDTGSHADAIVVLTGGNGRLEYGLQLLAQGKGKELFISGVGEGVTTEQLLQQLPIRATLTPADMQHITLGHQAENTIGNALETESWLKKNGYNSILLVTSNYHIPRSIDEFAEAAPDIFIIPAPVFSDDFSLTDWWNNPDSRFHLLSEYHKFLAAKLRHWLFPLRRL